MNKVPLDRTMGHNMPANFAWNSTGIEPPPTPAGLRKIEQERKKKLEEKQAEMAKIAAAEAEAGAQRKFEANRKAEEQRQKEKLQLAEQMNAGTVNIPGMIGTENET